MTIDPAEVIAKCEEMSAACLAVARNTKNGEQLRAWIMVSGAYDHCIAMLNGTDRSGPEYEAIKKRFDEGEI